MGMLAGGPFSQGGGGGQSQALGTTITSAEGKVEETTTTSPTTTYDINADGFDAGSDYYSNTTVEYSEPFGSIATATYTDGTSTSRTIDSCYWIEGAGSGNINPEYQTLTFTLDGTGIANADSTFYKIVISHATHGTQEFLRSDAHFFGTKNNGTCWGWRTVTDNPFSPLATYDFEVWVV